VLVHRRRSASLPDEHSVAPAKQEKREEELQVETEAEQEDKKAAVGAAKPAVPGRAVSASAVPPPPPPPRLQVPATPPPTPPLPPRAGSPCTPVVFSWKEVESQLEDVESQLEDVALDDRLHASHSGESYVFARLCSSYEKKTFPPGGDGMTCGQ
jgi:hypothetical protein